MMVAKVLLVIQAENEAQAEAQVNWSELNRIRCKWILPQKLLEQ